MVIPKVTSEASQSRLAVRFARHNFQKCVYRYKYCCCLLVVVAVLVLNLVRFSTSVNNKMIPTIIQEETRLVVSMKTIPSRIDLIEPVLNSLLFNQTMKPDTFYLITISKTLPPFLQEYQHQGLCTILYPPKDHGAIDKLVHVVHAEHQRQQSLPNTQILYLDDDVIYHPTLIEQLVRKSNHYHNACVAFSGAKLRSHFRQIGHSNEERDRHPFLYYRLGGVDSHNDTVVDIVQGFAGVVVRLGFFGSNFYQYIQETDSFHDDFVISAYLASRNVTKLLVTGGVYPNIYRVAAERNAISNRGMHRNAMIAAKYLQERLGVWKEFEFVPYESLTDQVKHMIDREARQDGRGPLTKKLDVILNVTTAR